MSLKKRNILVLDHNPEVLPLFSSAFHTSGYEVFVTDRIADAAAVVNGSDHTAGPFDLVVVDISDEGHRKFAADVENRDSRTPVFILRHDLDKSMLIDMLNQKRAEFIDSYIDSHKRAWRSQRGG